MSVDALTLAVWVVQGLVLYAASTVAFDVIHALLHAFARSSWRPLQWLASFHTVHHQFLGTDLRIDRGFERANLWWHHLPESTVAMVASTLGYLVFPPEPVTFVIALHAFLLGVRWWLRGVDGFHHEHTRVLRPLSGVFVGPQYHALHHVHPEQYIGSLLTVYDRVMGTGCPIAGQTFAVTGASGSFGSGMCSLLEARGATVLRLKHGVDWTYDDYRGADAALAAANVLVLAHGSKVDQAMEANADSFAVFTERFRALHANDLAPAEVWAVGSEIEVHPAFGDEAYYASKRAWARVARHLLHARDITYRHIVPSAFSSQMGPGLISGRTAAWIALQQIVRGSRYVPVTYSGLALVGWVKFPLRWHAVTPAAWLAARGLAERAQLAA
ncbi:MAG: hypothetical protein H6733_13040 [Alphaproteobacteria bacterium]|nr:hypothetical protein [Alphaproteobacteria bacterium]